MAHLPCDHIMKWTRGILSRSEEFNSFQLVGVAAAKDDDSEHIDSELRARLKSFISFILMNNGTLDVGKLIDKNQQVLLENFARKVVAPHVRKVVWQGGGAGEIESNDEYWLASLLESSPFLHSVEVHTVTNVHAFALALKGLARNSYRRLCRIQFQNISFQQVEPEVAQQIVQSLRRLESLREFHLVQSTIDVRRIFFKGLMGHANLACVTLNDGTVPFPYEEARAFLASLPNLKSFTSLSTGISQVDSLPLHVPHLIKLSLEGVGEGTLPRLVDVLRGAPHLREIRLPLTSLQSHLHDAMAKALAALPSLESLHIGRMDVEMLMGCRALQHLTCRRPLVDKNLATLLTQHPQLKSVKLRRPLNSQQITVVFNSLKDDNTSIRQLNLRLLDGQDVPPSFRETFCSSKKLTSLTLYNAATFVPVLASLLRNNTCCLQHLGLADIHFDATALLRALPHNVTLKSLGLYWRAATNRFDRNTKWGRGRLASSCWAVLLQVIPQLSSLKELELTCDCPIEAVLVDDLAEALCENLILTKVHVRHMPETQLALDYCCRLFSRRNRIRKMVKDNTLPVCLWPLVLESLAPSDVFMALSLGSCLAVHDV